MRALVAVLCTLLGALVLVAAVHAQDPASASTSANAAAQRAAAAAPSRFATIDRNSFDPTAEQKAAAEAAARDTVFSAEAAQKKMDGMKAQADAVAAPHAASQQQWFEQMMHSDASVMKLAGVDAKMQHEKDKPPVYRLYASRSLDAATMKDVLATARDHKELTVVFRGLLPGEKINHLAQYLAGLIGLNRDSKNQDVPSVVLDPTPFRANQVTVVPTLEKLDADGNVIASVRGITNPRWLDDRIARGERGDLGRFGPTVSIAEEDIVEVLKRELAKIDLKDAARKSLQRFWSRQTVWPLTKATRDRTRAVDPSVVLTDGISAPDGTVLAMPGERLNPMDVMPFNLTVIVIDVRDPVQLEFAKNLLHRLGTAPVSVITIAETDWASYQHHVVELGVPVYMLSQPIIERFALEHVPSVVTSGTNKTLSVREYALGSVPATAQGADHAGHHSANR